MRILHAFLIGFGSLFKGMDLLASSRSLRRTALIPFVLTAMVFLAGTWIGFPLLAQLIPEMAAVSLAWIGVAQDTIGHSALYWVIFILAWPPAIFALFYVLFMITRLVAAPFYAFLAERVLIERGLIEEREFRFVDWLWTNWRLLGVALLKISVFLFIGFFLLILSFVPGLGLAAAFGYLLMAAFDVVDMSFESMRLSFKERLRFFREELASFFGLATVMGLVFLVPGLNFFLFPAAVAGASEIIRHRSAQGR